MNFVFKDKKIFVFLIYPSQPSQVSKYADSSLRRTFAEPSQNDPVPSQILVFGYIFEFSDRFLLDEPSRCEGSFFLRRVKHSCEPFCEPTEYFFLPHFCHNVDSLLPTYPQLLQFFVTICQPLM